MRNQKLLKINLQTPQTPQTPHTHTQHLKGHRGKEINLENNKKKSTKTISINS